MSPLMSGPIHVMKCMRLHWICPLSHAYSLTSEFQMEQIPFSRKCLSTYASLGLLRRLMELARDLRLINTS